MKIGILTFHDGPNHGAFLQAWSTFRMLQNLGHQVEIINYKNVRHHEMESGWSVRRLKNPVFLWQSLRKQSAFKKAHRVFAWEPLITDLEELQRNHYDAVVIGSDVVWNYRIFGYDPAFFGQLNANKVVSFSASFGMVALDDAHPERMAADLSSFAAISVRDVNSQSIVAQQIDEVVPITLDPTLVYDFNDEIPQPSAKYREKYMLVYSYLHAESMIREVRSYASEHNLRVECVGYPPPLRSIGYCDRINMTANPFEWIRIFADAEQVVTSTFHGVVFSIKMRRRFWYIENAKAHNRVTSLLESCGIDHGLVLGREGKLHVFDPDYEMVFGALKPLARDSHAWLISQFKS